MQNESLQLLSDQYHVEAKYSRKNIRKKIYFDIDKDNPVFIKILETIKAYRNNLYYESKQLRIKKLKISNTSIACEILGLTLPINEIIPIQSLVAKLALTLNYKNHIDGVKTASELFAICESSGAYDIYHAKDHANRTGTLGIKPNFKLEAHTEAFINQTKYLPPMICKPIRWTTNKNGGYLKGSGSIILGNINHHNGKQDLDSINILQNIAWSFTDVLNYKEKSNKELNTNKKKIQFKQMCKNSDIVYDELLKQNNKFYFTWKYDKRGRMYSQGYHCNLQSTEYKKAIIQFNKQELIK